MTEIKQIIHIITIGFSIFTASACLIGAVFAAAQLFKNL